MYRRVRVDGSPLVHAFETHSSPFSGSVTRAAKRLRKRGITAKGSEVFLITSEPPLRDGEHERAAVWGGSWPPRSAEARGRFRVLLPAAVSYRPPPGYQLGLTHI